MGLSLPNTCFSDHMAGGVRADRLQCCRLFPGSQEEGETVGGFPPPPHSSNVLGARSQVVWDPGGKGREGRGKGQKGRVYLIELGGRVCGGRGRGGGATEVRRGHFPGGQGGRGGEERAAKLGGCERSGGRKMPSIWHLHSVL